MNQDLARLAPYPFERLRGLFSGISAPAGVTPINLSIGEPKHPTPQFIKDAVTANLGGLASYPSTLGTDALRNAIAQWIARRHQIAAPNPATQILPVAGSREALFAFSQVVLDRSTSPVVLCPNPFYQIYEGAALLGGATPHFVNADPTQGFKVDYAQVPEDVLARTQLVYVCSPGNPSGWVMALDEWRSLFELSARYGFVIASDECYSEIYFRDTAPLGALQAAALCGNPNFERLLVFSSLSKRSNVPGMRSGFVAGDAALVRAFTLYRTYHGTAMSPMIQAASTAAWNDEAHVAENRALYQTKFEQVTPLIASVLPCTLPDAAFYLWAQVPDGDDEAFARDLFAATGVTVLPGRYLARTTPDGANPGAGYVRIALVDTVELCLQAAQRIVQFCQTHRAATQS
jgi:N-succinyldiaminopimelate aminotransferase